MQTKTNVGLVIGRVVLLDGLKKLASVIPTKPSLQIFTAVKIVVSDDAITLEGCNSDDTMRVTLENENECSRGVYVVSYKSLIEFLKKSKAAEIEIDPLENGYKQVVRAGKIKYSITNFETSEFPMMPDIDAHEITLTKDEFLKAMKSTTYAAAKSESRPVLQGVNIELTNKGLSFVATDSHRLAKYESWNYTSDDYYKAIPSADKLQKAIKLVDKKCEAVTIGFDETYTILKFDNVEFFIKNCVGNYPDTSRLMPDDFNTEMTINTANFIESLEMMQILFSGDRNGVVRLKYDNEVELSTNGPARIESMESVLDAHSCSGESLKIAFSGHYMKEALKVSDAKEVKMAFTTPMRPFIMKPDENTTHLILPVRTY